MELTSNSSPPDNTSSSTLCPTVATLFFIPSIYTLLFFTTLPGNALSLWVFCRRIHSSSSIHVFLFHLSASNSMSSLTMPFLVAYYAWGVLWPLDGGLCRVILGVITPQLHINIYISLTILTLVAFSRFATLIQHTHAPRPNTLTTLLPPRFFTCLTRTTIARRVCVALWVLVVGGILPVTVYYSVKEAQAGAGVCYSLPVELGGRLSASFAFALMILFYTFYLLVLLCNMAVLRHIRHSRRSTQVPTSQILLGQVLRKIVVIQVVLSVCLLPYHIFKPILISLVHYQDDQTIFPEHDSCHSLSTIVEVKSSLLLLTALRGATDPLMFYMLDETFRRQIHQLFGCNKTNPAGRQMRLSGTGSVSQSAGQPVSGHVITGNVDLNQTSVL